MDRFGKQWHLILNQYDHGELKKSTAMVHDSCCDKLSSIVALTALCADSYLMSFHKLFHGNRSTTVLLKYILSTAMVFSSRVHSSKNNAISKVFYPNTESTDKLPSVIPQKLLLLIHGNILLAFMH